jgi:lipoprotein-releasing system permease protein
MISSNNLRIAKVYLSSKIIRSVLASLSVTFGVSIFIFINSVISGANNFFERQALTVTPHVKIFNETSSVSNFELKPGNPIINILNVDDCKKKTKINNPSKLVRQLELNSVVEYVVPQVSSNIIYTSRNAEIAGYIVGVDIEKENRMFNVNSILLSGSIYEMKKNPNGILIGSGISKRLNLKVGDNLKVSLSGKLPKLMKVAGVFETLITAEDNTKSYTNLQTVQELMERDKNYVTQIKVNFFDIDQAQLYSQRILTSTGYKTEDWKTSNKDLFTRLKVQKLIGNFVAVSILIVAGFGIYNILNMLIFEKIKDIAILKVIGYTSIDIREIFLLQSLFIGVIGATGGIFLAYIFSYLVSLIPVHLGYLNHLPMDYSVSFYIYGFVFGILTAIAGTILPARFAGRIDPEKIIRN